MPPPFWRWELVLFSSCCCIWTVNTWPKWRSLNEPSKWLSSSCIPIIFALFGLIWRQRKHHYSIHSQVASVFFPYSVLSNSPLAEWKHIESTHSLLSQSPCLRRCPCSSISKSSWLGMPGYGFLPLDTISHMVTPKDHCIQLKTVKKFNRLFQKKQQKYILTLTFRTDHITLAGVDGFTKALYGHPLDWHSDSNLLSIVVTAENLLGQAEVSHTYV